MKPDLTTRELGRLGSAGCWAWRWKHKGELKQRDRSAMELGQLKSDVIHPCLSYVLL
jgi:hypothetical protein